MGRARRGDGPERCLRGGSCGSRAREPPQEPPPPPPSAQPAAPRGPAPRGGNRVGGWKLSWQVNSNLPGHRCGPPGVRSPGSVAGDGGEEGSRGGSPGNESEAGGKVSGRPRPPSAAHNGSFPGIGAGKPGALGLGLGAAGESVQAVSCAPGGTGCSRAGPGGHRDHAARGLSQPSLLRLLCPLARQGLGCAGHLGWGWVSCGRAGHVAPRGLECRGTRVAKLASELQRGAESCCPLWS